MLRLLKVSGRSLEPRYRDGDFVVIGKIPILFGKIREGDEIVFRHPEYGTMIKIVEKMVGDEIYVIGAHAYSVDSRRFGPIRKPEVMGKVIWRIGRPRTR